MLHDSNRKSILFFWIGLCCDYLFAHQQIVEVAGDASAAEPRVSRLSGLCRGCGVSRVCAEGVASLGSVPRVSRLWGLCRGCRVSRVCAEGVATRYPRLLSGHPFGVL